MSKVQQKWVGTPQVGWKWVVATVVIWSAIFIPLFNSEVKTYLDAKISQPIQFQTRAYLGKEPPIDDSIRVYGIDDKTFSMMESWVLSIDVWTRLFENIAKNKPKAIFVDAIFSKTIDPNNKIADAIARLQNIDVPIVLGSFIAARKIKFRKPLDLSRPEFRIANKIASNSDDDIPQHAPPMFDIRNYYTYGPSDELAPYFKHIGHIVYSIPGRVAAFLRINDTTAIPHASFLMTDNVKFENKQLFINNNQVPLGRDGLLVPNFRSSKTIYKHTSSIHGILNKTLNGKRIKSIKEGDTVILLPLMYTGNVDFKPFPTGRAPGGFIHVSMIDSIITGRWLKTVEFGGVVVLLLILLGAILAIKVPQSKYFILMPFILILFIIGILYLFSTSSIIVPWLIPSIGFLASSFTVFGRKVHQAEKKSRILRQAFEGAVADDELKKLLKNPDQINLEARERIVSIVFVDVVGFSKLAEDMLPRIAFDHLASMLAHIGDTIHEHGGIIDRTLGDGLLAYFGYSFDQDKSTPNHAEQALRCMIAIQEHNLKQNLLATKNNEPVYPLRIGLNTASCYLGNLGSTNRIDFTVVGNGVNFAKRLEGACDIHSILIGSTTYDLIKGVDLNFKAMAKRFIRIKHHSELVESYEYDPFIDRPGDRFAALEGYRKCANIERIDQRWPVSDPTKIQLNCDYGSGDLINFSHQGFSIRLKQPLAKGTPLNVNIDAGNGTLKKLLEVQEVKVIQGEVRWQYNDGMGHVHGMMFSNISDQQSDFLVQHLVEFAFSTKKEKILDK